MRERNEYVRDRGEEEKQHENTDESLTNDKLKLAHNHIVISFCNK